MTGIAHRRVAASQHCSVMSTWKIVRACGWHFTASPRLSHCEFFLVLRAVLRELREVVVDGGVDHAGIDGPAPSARTGAKLEWKPEQPGLIAAIDHPAYFSLQRSRTSRLTDFVPQRAAVTPCI
jgi:hypothetical protein